MPRIQPARAAKNKALARLRVHCPSATVNLWDNLPIHLQAHICALAAETHLREIYPTIAQDAVVAAFRRKARQLVRKAMAVYNSRMAFYVCHARCEALLHQGAGVQLPAAASSALHQMRAAATAQRVAMHAYLAVLDHLNDMLVDVPIESHHSLNNPIYLACKAVWEVALDSARFYTWM
jgi:hypothetical protein